MYSLPDHLKPLPAIERMTDIKYKLTELGSLLEYLLKEIDQNQNPTMSLGELVIQYDDHFSEPWSVSTAIGIRNLKIHGQKPGGKTYSQNEIEQAPIKMVRGIDDLLMHVSPEIAEAVRRDQLDWVSLIETVFDKVDKMKLDSTKPSLTQTKPAPPPVRRINPQPISTSHSDTSTDIGALVGGIATVGLLFWLFSGTSSNKAASSKPTPSQPPIGCIVIGILFFVFLIVLALTTSTSK